MTKIKIHSKSKIKELSPKLKEIAERLQNCSQDDLVEVIDNVDYSITSEWKKSNFLQWVDVLNRFDSILEQSIASSSILQIGKKERHNDAKKSSQKSASSSSQSTSTQQSSSFAKEASESPQELSNFTPNPTLLLRILQFTSFLLKTVRRKSSYNSLEHICSLMQSENIDIVSESVNVLYEYVNRDAAGYFGRVSPVSGHGMVERALLFSHGYGPGSISLTCKESDLEASILQKGSSIRFEFYNDSYGNDLNTAKSSAKKQEKAIVRNSVQVVNVSNVHDEAKSPAELYQQIINAYNVSESDLEQLWTRIRLAFAFRNLEERKKWLIIRFKSIAILLSTTHQYPDMLASFLNFQPEFVQELKSAIEDGMLPHSVLVNGLHVFAAFASSRTRLSGIIDALIPTGASSFSGILPKLLSSATKFYLPDSDNDIHLGSQQDKELFDALFSLLTAVASGSQGAKVLHDSGLINDIVALLTTKTHDAEHVIEQCLRIIDLLFLHKQSVAQTAQSGAVQEAVILLNKYLSICELKIENLKDYTETASDFLTNSQFEILRLSFKILISATTYRASQINIRDIYVGELLSHLNNIIEKSEYYGSQLFNKAITALTAALNREPTYIPGIKQAGTLKILLEKLNNLPVEADSICIIPPLLSAFSLNNTCFEEIKTEGAYLKLLNLLTDKKYVKTLSQEVSGLLGKDINEFMRHHTEIREIFVDYFISFLKKLEERTSSESAFSDSESDENEDTNLTVSVSNVFRATGEMLSNTADHGKLFIEKGGLEKVLLIAKNTYTKSKFSKLQSKIYLTHSVLSICRRLSRHHSTQVFAHLVDAVSVELHDLENFDEKNDSHIKSLDIVSNLLRSIFSLVGQNNVSFLAEWTTTKGKDLSDMLTKLDRKVRWHIAKRTIQEEEAKKVEEATQVTAEVSTTSTPSSTASSSVTSSSNTKKRRPSLKKQKKPDDQTGKSMNTFVTAALQLYDALQKAVFFGVREYENRRAGTQPPSQQAHALAKELSSHLITLISDFNNLNGSIETKCLYMTGIASCIHSIIVSERHRNCNTLVLKEFLQAKGVDIFCDIFEQLCNAILNLKAEKTGSANEEKYPAHCVSYLVAATKFLRRIVALPSIVNSPMTSNLLLSDNFDPSKFLTELQQVVAKRLVTLWKQPALFKISDDFSTLFVNVISHIAKGIDSGNEADPHVALLKKQTDPSTVQVDQVLLNQLTDMGFPAKKVEDALRRTQNNFEAAFDWILANIDNETTGNESPAEEEDDDEDEIEKAIRMSMEGASEQNQHTEKEKEPAIDYVDIIKQDVLQWTFNILQQSRSLAHPCADILSLQCHNEQKRSTLVALLIDKIRSLNNPDGVKEQALESLMNTVSQLCEHVDEFRTQIAGEDASLWLMILKEVMKQDKLSNTSKSIINYTLETLAFLTKRPKPKSKEKEYSIETYSEELSKHLLAVDMQQEILNTSISMLDEHSKLSANLVGGLMMVIANTTQSAEISEKMNYLEFVEKMLNLPASLKPTGFSVDMDRILRSVVEDDTLLLQSMKQTIRKKLPTLIATHGRVSAALFLQQFTANIERNPKLFFDAVKQMCRVRSNGSIQLHEEKQAEQEEQKPSENKRVNEILNLMLTHLVTYTPSEKPQNRKAMEQYNILKFVGDFVRMYNCSRQVIDFKHEAISNNGGRNEILRYLLKDLLPYPCNPSYRDAVKNPAILRKLPASRMAAYLLSTLCAAEYAEIFTEINELMTSFSSSASISPLRTLHAVADLIYSLISNKSTRGSRTHSEKMFKLMNKYGIVSSLTEGLGQFDLNHPDAPEVTNAVLKPIELLIRTSGAKKGTEDVDVKHLDIEYTPYFSEYTRVEARLTYDSQTEAQESEQANAILQSEHGMIEADVQTEDEPENEETADDQTDEPGEETADEQTEDVDEGEEDEDEEIEEDDSSSDGADDEHELIVNPSIVFEDGNFAGDEDEDEVEEDVTAADIRELIGEARTSLLNAYRQSRLDEEIEVLEHRSPAFEPVSPGFIFSSPMDQFERSDPVADQLLSDAFRLAGNSRMRFTLPMGRHQQPNNNQYESVNLGVSSSNNSALPSLRVVGTRNLLFPNLFGRSDRSRGSSAQMPSGLETALTNLIREENPSNESNRSNDESSSPSPREESDLFERFSSRLRGVFTPQTVNDALSETPLQATPLNISTNDTATTPTTPRILEQPQEQNEIEPAQNETIQNQEDTNEDKPSTETTTEEPVTPAPSTSNAQEENQSTSNAEEQSSAVQSSSNAQTTPREFAIDPTFLSALPDDLRQEVLSANIASLMNTSTSQNTESTISEEFLNALPTEIRAEVLEQERVLLQNRQRNQASQTQPTSTAQPAAQNTEAQNTGGNGDTEIASFIASLSPDLREEVLLTTDESVLMTLPQDIQAEAFSLRNQYFARQQRRTMQQRRSHNDSRSSLLSKSILSMVLERDGNEDEGEPILTETQVASILRLVYISRSTSKSLMQKILYSLCSHRTLRNSILYLLLGVLQYHSTPEDAIPARLSKVVIPKVFGVSSHAGFSLKEQTAAIPVGIMKRFLDVLIYLTKDPKVLAHISQHIDADEGKDLASERTNTVAKLFSHLSDPYFSSSGKMIEQLMQLLDLCVSYLRKSLKTLKKEIHKDKELLKKFSEENKEEKSEEEATKLRERLEKAESEKAKLMKEVTYLLSEETVRQIVKVLVRADCSEQGVKFAVSIMNNMSSAIPDIRKIILKELSEVARAEAHQVVKTLNSSSRKSEKSVGKTSIASTKKSLQELKFCRILRTYTAVLKAEKKKQREKKKEDKTSEEVSIEYQSTHFLKENSLDFVWEALDDYLSNIPDDDDEEEEDAENKEKQIVKKKPKKKSTTLYGSLLPLVEAFFSFHSGYVEENEESHNELTAHMETTPTSLSPKSRVEVFLEKNRKFLNSLVRSNPSLLHTTLSLMMKYPRFVDFDNKRSWFRSKLTQDQQRNSYGTLRINVKRDRIFDDSFYQLRQRDPEELKEKISVRFVGEEGVDAGGLTKEWFSVLSKAMLNPAYGLFIQCADKTTYQPNPASHFTNNTSNEHLQYFRFIGRVIAMAIYNEQYLDCYFTRSFYKHILGVPIRYQDIESIDPDYYKNLKWMLDNSIEGVLDYTFTQEVDEFGTRRQVELKPDGKNIPVTDENKHEYVRLVTELKMTTSIKSQLVAFLEGFFEIISKDLISIFNEQELELLMNGLPEVDIEDLRANTEYEGYSENSPTIQWFWKTVESMNRNEKALLIQFVTGTSKVPLGGFKSLLGMHGIQRFNIHRVQGSDRLPSAHTCFNQLDLPEYSSEDELRDRLFLAIREGSEGFGFV